MRCRSHDARKRRADHSRIPVRLRSVDAVVRDSPRNGSAAIDRRRRKRARRRRRDGAAAKQNSMRTRGGIVYLVGAGPGDPGLLTQRAADLIARADLVAVDALVSPDIVAMIHCEIVYVGKRSSAHTLPQDQINQLL